MRHWSAALLGIVLLCSLCMPAAAQWKWRDKNGQTQYSDLPPPQGTPESAVLQRPAGAKLRNVPPADIEAAASAPAMPAPKTVEPELEAKLRKAEQEKAAKSKAEDEKIALQKAENCSRARSQVRVIDEGLRIARINEKGEREVLDDKGRAEEGNRARAVIASDCK
ncbi:MAG: DUF4124 domain-containing protein [Burkholderiaceae bacterium]|nr:DUF4124 domain-containing protein [Burkholderiaceae bacterium]